MTNHYRKLRAVKSIIDNSSPKGYEEGTQHKRNSVLKKRNRKKLSAKSDSSPTSLSSSKGDRPLEGSLENSLKRKHKRCQQELAESSSQAQSIDNNKTRRKLGVPNNSTTVKKHNCLVPSDSNVSSPRSQSLPSRPPTRRSPTDMPDPQKCPSRAKSSGPTPRSKGKPLHKTRSPRSQCSPHSSMDSNNSASENSQPTPEKNSTEKKSTAKKSPEKRSTEKNSTEKKSTEKNSIEKNSTEKNSTERKSSDKKSTEKNGTEKNSSEKNTPERRNSRVKEHEYLQFALRITEDIIRNDLFTNKDIKRVFNSHIQANRCRLDMKRMQEKIDDIASQLNVPAEEPLDDDTTNRTEIRNKRQTVKSSLVCICGPIFKPLNSTESDCECGSERCLPFQCRKHGVDLESIMGEEDETKSSLECVTEHTEPTSSHESLESLYSGKVVRESQSKLNEANNLSTASQESVLTHSEKQQSVEEPPTRNSSADIQELYKKSDKELVEDQNSSPSPADSCICTLPKRISVQRQSLTKGPNLSQEKPMVEGQPMVEEPPMVEQQPMVEKQPMVQEQQLPKGSRPAKKVLENKMSVDACVTVYDSKNKASRESSTITQNTLQNLSQDEKPESVTVSKIKEISVKTKVHASLRNYNTSAPTANTTDNSTQPETLVAIKEESETENLCIPSVNDSLNLPKTSMELQAGSSSVEARSGAPGMSTPNNVPSKSNTQNVLAFPENVPTCTCSRSAGKPIQEPKVSPQSECNSQGVVVGSTSNSVGSTREALPSSNMPQNVSMCEKLQIRYDNNSAHSVKPDSRRESIRSPIAGTLENMPVQYENQNSHLADPTIYSLLDSGRMSVLNSKGNLPSQYQSPHAQSINSESFSHRNSNRMSFAFPTENLSLQNEPQDTHSVHSPTDSARAPISNTMENLPSQYEGQDAYPVHLGSYNNLDSGRTMDSLPLQYETENARPMHPGTYSYPDSTRPPVATKRENLPSQYAGQNAYPVHQASDNNRDSGRTSLPMQYEPENAHPMHPRTYNYSDPARPHVATTRENLPSQCEGQNAYPVHQAPDKNLDSGRTSLPLQYEPENALSMHPGTYRYPDPTRPPVATTRENLPTQYEGQNAYPVGKELYTNPDSGKAMESLPLQYETENASLMHPGTYNYPDTTRPPVATTRKNLPSQYDGQNAYPIHQGPDNNLDTGRTSLPLQNETKNTRPLQPGTYRYPDPTRPSVATTRENLPTQYETQNIQNDKPQTNNPIDSANTVVASTLENIPSRYAAAQNRRSIKPEGHNQLESQKTPVTRNVPAQYYTQNPRTPYPQSQTLGDTQKTSTGTTMERLPNDNQAASTKTTCATVSRKSLSGNTPVKSTSPDVAVNSATSPADNLLENYETVSYIADPSCMTTYSQFHTQNLETKHFPSINSNLTVQSNIPAERITLQDFVYDADQLNSPARVLKHTGQNSMPRNFFIGPEYEQQWVSLSDASQTLPQSALITGNDYDLTPQRDKPNANKYHYLLVDVTTSTTEAVIRKSDLVEKNSGVNFSNDELLLSDDYRTASTSTLYEVNLPATISKFYPTISTQTNFDQQEDYTTNTKKFSVKLYKQYTEPVQVKMLVAQSEEVVKLETTYIRNDNSEVVEAWSDSLFSEENSIDESNTEPSSIEDIHINYVQTHRASSQPVIQHSALQANISEGEFSTILFVEESEEKATQAASEEYMKQLDRSYSQEVTPSMEKQVHNITENLDLSRREKMDSNFEKSKSLAIAELEQIEEAKHSASDAMMIEVKTSDSKLEGGGCCKFKKTKGKKKRRDILDEDEDEDADGYTVLSALQTAQIDEHKASTTKVASTFAPDNDVDWGAVKSVFVPSTSSENDIEKMNRQISAGVRDQVTKHARTVTLGDTTEMTKVNFLTPDDTSK